MNADACVALCDPFFVPVTDRDRKICESAGVGLSEEYQSYVPLEKGKAVITSAHDCSYCRYIIHACVSEDDEESIRNAYRNCLQLAADHELESLAVPVIGMSDKEKSADIAREEIASFLEDHELNVFLLVSDRKLFEGSSLLREIRDHLARYLQPVPYSASYAASKKQEKEKKVYHKRKEQHSIDELFETLAQKEGGLSFHGAVSYDAVPKESRFEPDESFSECLIRMIDEKGMRDPDVYKRANIDRKLFNHIKNTKLYRPKRETAVALAIGMRLNMKETDSLLEKAGFVLSRSSKFDLIIRDCIDRGIYDIYRINEILFAEDEKTLGC